MGSGLAAEIPNQKTHIKKTPKVLFFLVSEEIVLFYTFYNHYFSSIFFQVYRSYGQFVLIVVTMVHLKQNRIILKVHFGCKIEYKKRKRKKSKKSNKPTKKKNPGFCQPWYTHLATINRIFIAGWIFWLITAQREPVGATGGRNHVVAPLLLPRGAPAPTGAAPEAG